MSFDEEIHELWKQNDTWRGKHVPRFYGDIQPCRFLSVGMNPSLPRRCPDFLEPILRQRGLTYPDCYRWDQLGLAGGFVAEMASPFIELHQQAVSNYPFFGRPRQVAQAFGTTELQHADLFLFMCPSLKGLPEDYGSIRNHRFSSNPNFVQQQLNLSLRIIRAYEPEIILFVYARAADIFREFLTSHTAALPLQFKKFGNTPVSYCKVELTPGRGTFCIRWPALPKNCRGSMSDDEITGLLPDLINLLN
jgi:hypothetical protein